MMEDMVKHKGRFAQMRIYLGKLLRMFAYQNDWKVLPMGAFIAAVVTLVVGANMFVNQEGTVNGAFALTCVCIWNGFFNSIQVVCRERAVVKREHRAGLHMSSYIAAHMIYQFILCLAQFLTAIFQSGLCFFLTGCARIQIILQLLHPLCVFLQTLLQAVNICFAACDIRSQRSFCSTQF